MMDLYKNREHAGRVLAEEIQRKANYFGVELSENNCVTLSIPDEGIIPGYTLTKSLKIKMNLLVVGKLKVPGTDTGIGSISIDGTSVLNDEMINRYRLTREQINEIERTELNKMIDKIETYEIAQINLKKLKERFVIIVDEGAKTGYSIIGAIKSINLINPKQIVIAIPTASFHAIMKINRYTHHITCPKIVDTFSFTIEDAYDHYHKLDQKTVLDYIDRLKKENLLFV
ncbi:MAG: hypothetical protein GF329_03255 [Candidatus Lokiarchaeota archaeon]|nr:hypothetical protein [Candidatus Lokiarchaeota archaeon]